MDYRKNNLCLGIVGIIFGAPSVFGAFYHTDDLGNNCGQNISISCPTLAVSTGMAGTLHWSPPPSSNCTVNFTLDTNTLNCGGMFSPYFAIYLSVRKFDIPSGRNGDTVEIYENRYGNRTLVKSLSGYEPALNGAVSVAQMLSLYSKRPAFTINYVRKSLEPVRFREVIIDYVIVEKSFTPYNTYCSALEGYVNEDFICDDDYPNDRCNCPSSLTTHVSGGNPACERRSCVTKLSGVMIGGIIFGSTGLIVICIMLGLVARRRHQQNIIVSRSSHHQSTVVAPYQPMLLHQTAPPAYNQQGQLYASQ